MKRSIAVATITLLLSLLSAFGQVRPIYDQGALGVGRAIRQLRTTASVMMIGAHPDDEDSALLAFLARGENARTAYLSLTRGDGGQNILGSELFEPLGIIRTEELLQARRLDGGEQYFTRAFDYGFSKTLDEAKSKWPTDVVKCDIVRAIRAFRPLVVISRFSGATRDGHGQHQYAGYISPIAVAAAADPSECRESGEVWQVKKFYIEQGFGATDDAPLKINTGKYDQLLGRSYFEVAMEGRSMHRSQGEGRVELKGDQFSGLMLKQKNDVVIERSVFDGIDTGIIGIAKLANDHEPLLSSKLNELSNAVTALDDKNASENNDETIRSFTRVFKIAKEAENSTKNELSKIYLREVERKAADGLKIAGGIQIDALADRETVVPGGFLKVSVKVFAASDLVGDLTSTIRLPLDWSVSMPSRKEDDRSGAFGREQGRLNNEYKITVSDKADNTQPYWLTDKRNGDLFAWSDHDSQTLPFAADACIADIKANINGVEVKFSQPIQFRFADPARGEVRRDINVVPPISISFDKDLIIVPLKDLPMSRHIMLRVNNNSLQPQSFTLRAISSDKEIVHLTLSNEKIQLAPNASANIELTAEFKKRSSANSFLINIQAMIGDDWSGKQMHVIAYPHIQTHRYYTDANFRVSIIDLKADERNVGYVMGTGDDVPDAIRQMGMKVTMLDEKALTSGDLSKYDAIMIGIRASETRPDLVANNSRLLEYARGGGNVIVQYQRGNWTSLAPYPVTVTDGQRTAAGQISRVVDENAKVTILSSDDAFIDRPNKITYKDFDGWVQERNAYNIVTFGDEYKPLLESHDAGEKENRGGLLRADIGKGSWTYCSYSFFRQLPAGVPGAYRLLANILNYKRQ